MSRTPVNYIPMCDAARSGFVAYVDYWAEDFGYESTQEFLDDFGVSSVNEILSAIHPWSDFTEQYGNPSDPSDRGDYYILHNDFIALFGDAQFLLDDLIPDKCGVSKKEVVFYYSTQAAIGPY